MNSSWTKRTPSRAHSVTSSGGAHSTRARQNIYSQRRAYHEDIGGAGAVQPNRSSTSANRCFSSPSRSSSLSSAESDRRCALRSSSDEIKSITTSRRPPSAATEEDQHGRTVRRVAKDFRGGAPISVKPAGRVWRKVLYERQPFEDNYVDPLQFLQELRKNENIQSYQYADVVKDTFAITQQISVVVLFVFVFAMIITGKMEHYSVLYLDIVMFLIAWVVYTRLHPHRGTGAEDGVPLQRTEWTAEFLEYGRQAVSLGSILFLLAPIFSTLTVTYSDDTIVALSILTMAYHVITSDYSYLNAYTEKYQPNLSMNSATFGVILMASRIPSPMESGALIAFGAICFTLSPIARHLIKQYSFTAHVGVTFLLFGLATGCLVQIPILAVFYVTTIVATSFVIPWCFVVLHSNVKHQINGPWDEAKPTNSAAAAEWANAGLLA